MSRLHDAYWDHAHGVGNRCHVDGESLGVDAIDHQTYRGCRYSFGYAACPTLENRAKVVKLLDPTRIGAEMSQEPRLRP